MLLTTEASGQVSNVSCYDPSTGTLLLSFKSGASGPRTLCTVGNDYVISAVKGKPLIHVWSLHKKVITHNLMHTDTYVCLLAIA